MSVDGGPLISDSDSDGDDDNMYCLPVNGSFSFEKNSSCSSYFVGGVKSSAKEEKIQFKRSSEKELKEDSFRRSLCITMQVFVTYQYFSHFLTIH
jgi:hypothetical protein